MRDQIARTLAGNPATRTAARPGAMAPAGSGRSGPKTAPAVQGGLFKQWQAMMPAKHRGMGGMSRGDWMAANPRMASQFRDWRREQVAAMPQRGMGRGSEFTNQFISQMPDLLMREISQNTGGYAPTNVDWNDPASIRAAAGSLHLPQPLSAYMRHGGRRGPITPPRDNGAYLGGYGGQLPEYTAFPRINWNDGSG